MPAPYYRRRGVPLSPLRPELRPSVEEAAARYAVTHARELAAEDARRAEARARADAADPNAGGGLSSFVDRFGDSQWADPARKRQLR